MKPSVDDVLVAVRAKCLDCSGNSQKLVEQCTIRDCPLYPYRSIRAMGVPKLPVEVKCQLSIFEDKE